MPWVSATTPSTFGIVGQQVALDPRRDLAGDGGRAVHAGQHADIVAGADLAVGAAETLEGRALGFRHVIGRAGIGPERVVAHEVVHLDVMDMDMAAGLDVRGGETDDLIVFPDRLALGDGNDRDLVAARNTVHAGDVGPGDRRSGQQCMRRRESRPQERRRSAAAGGVKGCQW